LNVTNGTYVFVVNAPGYVSNDSTGNLTVNGANVSRTVHFSFAPYRVTFSESGLASGAVWQATLQGVVGGGIGDLVFAEPNGSFAYSVASHGNLYPTPSSGIVVVSGSNVTVLIAFMALTYPIVFTETGLPAGTSWTINVNGTVLVTTGSYQTVDEPNGSYSYTVAPVPGFSSSASGTVIVSGALSSTLVVFHRYLFNLTFQESGLPSGTGWGVLIGGQSESAVTPNLTFVLPDGTYGFVVLAIPGYTDSIKGPAVVNGSDTMVDVRFVPQTFPIVFIQFGLPVGTNWSVTVSNLSLGVNRTQSSTGSSITFFLPNGTYAISFAIPPGFAANASSTVVTVAGQAATGGVITAAAPTTGPAPQVVKGIDSLEVGLLVGAVGAGGLLGFGARWWYKPPRSRQGIDRSSPYHPYRQAVEEEAKLATVANPIDRENLVVSDGEANPTENPL
jgi:hypothetical protein